MENQFATGLLLKYKSGGVTHSVKVYIYYKSFTSSVTYCIIIEK